MGMHHSRCRRRRHHHLAPSVIYRFLVLPHSSLIYFMYRVLTQRLLPIPPPPIYNSLPYFFPMKPHLTTGQPLKSNRPLLPPPPLL